jgi:Spy/CpxP family protein refolding chaperone
MLAEKLNLTDDQKAKLKPIIEDEMKAMHAVREDKSLDRKAKWGKIEEIRKAHREQIRALLTPEQQKKLDELKEEHGPRPGGPEQKHAS